MGSSKPQPAATPAGDHITQVIKNRGSQPRPQPKRRKPKEKKPSFDGDQLRAQMAQLGQEVEDLSAAFKAESEFLRSKLPEEDTAPLKDMGERVQRLQRQVAGLKGQASTQHKQARDNNSEIHETAAGLEDARTQIEELRASLDELHELVQSEKRRKSYSRRALVDGVEVGHIEAGLMCVSTGYLSVAVANRLAGTAIRMHPLAALALFATGACVHEFQTYYE